MDYLRVLLDMRMTRIVWALIFILISENGFSSIAKIYGGPQLKKAPRLVPRVRVRVQKNLANVFVSGTDLKRKLHITQKTKTYHGRKAVKFKCHSLTQGQSPSKPILLASLASGTGLISLSKEKYKGLLHIVTTPGNESCDVIHETDIEDYLSSLLSKEMNAVWPIEALKAQAVAARTYAIHKMETREVNKVQGFETYYHMESSEKHQVGGTFFDSTKKTQKAANETAGVVLVNSKEKIVPAFFHAGCGGKTLRPDHVWQNRVKGYKTVHCAFCNKDSKRNFRKFITASRFKRFIKWASERDLIAKDAARHLKSELRVVPHKKYSRNLRVYLGDKPFVLKKSSLRRYFGRVLIPSNNFVLEMPNKKRLRVRGSGNGHGVGMCQLGALHLAQRGWDYKRILSYYFPGYKIKKLY